MTNKKWITSVLCYLAAHGMSVAHDTLGNLGSTVVYSKMDYLIGLTTAASTGFAGPEELSQRATLRRGELLELVPGMIVTQHAGGGKANQYFVRGFNLDHGTDFHIGVDGMPANYRTHAHGQGYADINFLVPEFIEHLDHGKGPFNVRYGDLSTAGYAEYKLFNSLPRGIFSTTYGSYDYARILYGDSWKIGKDRSLTFGIEYSHENGPWDLASDYDRYNMFARYYQEDDSGYWSVTALAHQGQWNSSDQVPLSAIQSGEVNEYGFVDPTNGGDTSRYSLSTQWHQDGEAGTTHVDAWVGFYDLELFSNFTYFLNDPVRGDQFEQNESRVFSGFHLWHQWDHQVWGKDLTTRAGFSSRNDFINDIGLYLTEKRQRHDTIRQDDVYVGSFSLYVDQEIRLNDWLRFGAGVRGDLFHFDVDSDLDANSGNENDSIVSPKAHFIFGPWNETEMYLNAGLGFHSNDARGVTIAVDPADGVTPLDSVDPLVRTKGIEWGVRDNTYEKLTSTFSLWYLESDSELVYIGDAGVSEAGPASRRWGVELTSYLQVTDYVRLDAEYSWSHARFVGTDSGMDYIPNALKHMASAGITIGDDEGYFGSIHGRYFSPRPLVESGEITSDASLIFNGRIGYRKQDWEVSLDVLNIFDRHDNDVEYYYESRLTPMSPAAEGRHVHPAEPRQVRLNFIYKF